MMRSIAVALAVVVAGAGASAVTAEAKHGPRPTQGQLIAGVGHFTLVAPDSAGHKIRFAVHARTDRHGTARGSFRFRHLLANGALLAYGRADVTCLQNSGDTAIFTAIVTREHVEGEPGNMPFGPHAFSVKVIDGDSGPDQVVFAQAIGAPEPLDPTCFDVEQRFPGQLTRFPIERGGYLIRD